MLDDQALHLEVGSLGIVLRRIQDAVASMNQQVREGLIVMGPFNH